MVKFGLNTGKLILLMCLSLLVSCSDKDSETVDETFSVTLSAESFDVEVGATYTIDLNINKNSDFDITSLLSKTPEFGTVNISSDLSSISYTAPDETVTGSFYIRFESQSMFITKEVSFNVINAEDDPTDDETPTTEEPTGDSDNYIIRFPSDYIALFEHETVTFDIKRNYQQSDAIVEAFYFNASNVTGRVSNDKNQITLTAKDGNADTYGELIAVTNVDGTLYESKMYIVYFNKNRDLTTEEAPVIALLDTDLLISPYTTITKEFDIYDGDSDRMAYRVLSAPNYVATHINKTTQGYELTLNVIDEIDSSDTDLVIQVSDAHNTDLYTFNLVNAGTTNSANTTNTTKQSLDSVNNPPEIFIEENVAVSLIQKMDPAQTGLVAELAFAVSDADDDLVDISVSSSNSNLTFRVDSPFIYVSTEDISGLQYDQITVVASDGQFDSKLTFHLYIADNYTEFLGGNPNIAPFSDLPSSINILESKTIEVPFQSEDFEMHPFNVGVSSISEEALTSITSTALFITASTPDASLTTPITVWFEDIFKSRREYNIDVNIYKNTPPVLSIESSVIESFAIEFIEQQDFSLSVTVDDIDQPDLQPIFSYDETKLIVDYTDSVLTVSSVDLEQDYNGEITVSVQDEFGETDTAIIDVSVRYISPDNAPPVITFGQDTFIVLPSECFDTSVTVTDADNDPLTLQAASSNPLLTFDWDQDLETVSFCVDATSEYEQEFSITFSASDGIILTEKNLNITVPRSPSAPTLEILAYDDEIDENDTFTVNYRISDLNGGDMLMSATNVSADIVVNISQPVLIDNTDPDADIFIYEGSVEVTTPYNVNAITTFTFNLTATDNTAAVSTKAVPFSVLPVNNPPTLTMAETEIVLTNDVVTTLGYVIEDPDSSNHDIEVRIESNREDVYDFTVDYGLYDLKLYGLSKLAVYDYVRGVNATVPSGTESAQFDMLIRIEDDATFPATAYTTVLTKFRFENEKPVIGSDDKIVIKGARPIQTSIPLALTDADGEDIEIISVQTTSAAIEVVNSLANINLTKKITVNAVSATSGVPAAITINVSDGFEVTAKQIEFEIID